MVKTTFLTKKYVEVGLTWSRIPDSEADNGTPEKYNNISNTLQVFMEVCSKSID